MDIAKQKRDKIIAKYDIIRDVFFLTGMTVFAFGPLPLLQAGAPIEILPLSWIGMLCTPLVTDKVFGKLKAKKLSKIDTTQQSNAKSFEELEKDLKEEAKLNN